jgi:hypothetical protein
MAKGKRHIVFQNFQIAAHEFFRFFIDGTFIEGSKDVVHAYYPQESPGFNDGHAGDIGFLHPPLYRSQRIRFRGCDDVLRHHIFNFQTENQLVRAVGIF